MVIVFYAFSREIAALKRRLKNRTPLSRKGLSGFQIRTEAGEVSFIATGIGLRMARIVVRRAFEALPETEFVIGTGVAGALSGGLRPGDIVIADRVMKARDDTAHAEQVFPVAAETVADCERILHGAGLEFSTGGILTSSRVIPNAEAKRIAKGESGAIAVDMESATIALEATARGIPFAIVRSIVDSLEDEVFGAEIADEQGRVKPMAAANYLMRNPGAVLRLPWMIRNLALATRALADSIEALCYRAAP